MGLSTPAGGFGRAPCPHIAQSTIPPEPLYCRVTAFHGLPGAMGFLRICTGCADSFTHFTRLTCLMYFNQSHRFVLIFTHCRSLHLLCGYYIFHRCSLISRIFLDFMDFMDCMDSMNLHRFPWISMDFMDAFHGF